mmetsp:Transcript_56336/g.101252  ORF Transcript_56336/g.101252 Transcript_56336/m.101252 type:complete len:150 (-) Transcript_56336:222-671(-)
MVKLIAGIPGAAARVFSMHLKSMRFVGVQVGDPRRSCLTVKLKARRGAAGGFSSFHLQGLGFVGVQSGDLGRSCLMVKLRAGIRGGVAGGFSSFHLHALRVGVQIGDPGPDDLGRFEGVQSDELEHGDLRRLYGDDVREGGPLDGEGDL